VQLVHTEENIIYLYQGTHEYYAAAAAADDKEVA